MPPPLDEDGEEVRPPQAVCAAGGTSGTYVQGLLKDMTEADKIGFVCLMSVLQRRFRHIKAQAQERLAAQTKSAQIEAEKELERKLTARRMSLRVPHGRTPRMRRGSVSSPAQSPVAAATVPKVQRRATHAGGGTTVSADAPATPVDPLAATAPVSQSTRVDPSPAVHKRAQSEYTEMMQTLPRGGPVAIDSVEDFTKLTRVALLCQNKFRAQLVKARAKLEERRLADEAAAQEIFEEKLRQRQQEKKLGAISPRRTRRGSVSRMSFVVPATAASLVSALDTTDTMDASKRSTRYIAPLDVAPPIPQATPSSTDAANSAATPRSRPTSASRLPALERKKTLSSKISKSPRAGANSPRLKRMKNKSK